MQDRDRELLRALAVLRVIDREQTKLVAGFGSTTRANARLLVLTRAGLLRRFFLGTVGGARKALYSLSVTGAHLVDVPYRGPRRRQDETLIADFFVTHQLSVNEVLLAGRKVRDLAVTLTFIRWEAFHESLQAAPPVIPDGYLEFVGPKPLAAFLEIDLGHESAGVWKKKVEAYLRYAVSGECAVRFGQPQFRVLVVANSERRSASLRATTAALTQKIFWFTTLAAIREGGFWSPIWTRPKDAQPVSLVEIP